MDRCGTEYRACREDFPVTDRCAAVRQIRRTLTSAFQSGGMSR
ncbi:MAG: hypothetical protein WC114_06850 [Smithellaceae bacterium]